MAQAEGCGSTKCSGPCPQGALLPTWAIGTREARIPSWEATRMALYLVCSHRALICPCAPGPGPGPCVPASVLPATGPASPMPQPFSSLQVYFFCSASACSRSRPETCSTDCGSGTASESGLGGLHALTCPHAWCWLPGH